MYTDSLNVCTVMSKGSMVEDLQRVSIEIFNLCKAKNVKSYPHWVERALNTVVDGISKIRGCADWIVDQSIFEYFDQIWGPHDFDRFANAQNTKWSRFNSKFLCPGTSGVECFRFNWQGFNN